MENFKDQLNLFLQSSKIVVSALKPLKPGAKIRLEVDNKISILLEKTTTGIKIVDNDKSPADISFVLNFEAARHLLSHQQLEKSEFAIEMIKQAGLGNLKMLIHRSTISLMRMGFINAITSIGTPFWSHLSQTGVEGIGKVLQILNKIRTNPK